MFENFDKDYLKRVLLRVVCTILGLLMIIYIGYQIWHKASSFVEYEPAVPYSYTERVSGDGYIFRKETVIPKNGAGSAVPSVDAGTKVSLNGEVAKMYSASLGDSERRLAEIDDQIALLTLSARSADTTNKDVSKIDGEVYSIITDMRRSISSGDYSKALSFRTGLISEINRKNAVSGTGGDVGARIAELEAEKASITSQLGTMLGTVAAPAAGWYYPETDGYEASFDYSAIKDLNCDSFARIISASPTDTSAYAGKVVTSPNWYFVCEMDSEKLKTKIEGEEYTVFFPYNQNIKIVMTLEKICPGNSTGLAVFVSDKMPEGFDFARMQSYELLEKEYNGFRIPRSAARIVDGYDGVYVLSGEVVRFRRIDIMTEHDGYYIVKMDHGENIDDGTGNPDTSKEKEKVENDSGYDWLGLNENVITAGKGLKDGSVITNLK